MVINTKVTLTIHKATDTAFFQTHLAINFIILPANSHNDGDDLIEKQSQ